MISPKSMDSSDDRSHTDLKINSPAAHAVTATASMQSPINWMQAVWPTKARSKTRMPHRSEAIRTRIKFPDPRKDGSFPYLRQLGATCLALVAADLATLLAVVSFCSLIGLTWLNPLDETSRATVWLPSIGLALILVNSVMGLYPGLCLGFIDEFRRLSMSITVVALINAARLRVTAEFFADRLLFLSVAYVLCLFLAPVARSIVRKLLAKTRWWGFPALVCGNDSVTFGVDQWLLENRRLGLRSLGVIADPEALEIDRDNPRFLGPWSEARSIAEERHAYWAIVVESEELGRAQNDVTAVIEQYLGNVPQVFVVSRLTGIPDQWNRHRLDEGLPGVLIEHHLQLPIPKLVKRGMDLAIATIASIVLAPLFVVLSVIIKCTSRGPVFYGHERVGFANTRFKAWKFRTMIDNAEAELEQYLSAHPDLRAEWERDHKLRNDPRVTWIGKWMRKWSIDELPQLWNVFIGEMSAVGPRPIVPNEITKYGDHFEMFCSVLPGMTGLWQVCGRNDTSFDERIKLGVYYIHHWSPWMDIYLLVRTIHTVLFTRGAY
jgi:Undecaprenyl-phosphate galactose phosphotransferase WbaP